MRGIDVDNGEFGKGVRKYQQDSVLLPPVLQRFSSSLFLSCSSMNSPQLVHEKKQEQSNYMTTSKQLRNGCLENKEILCFGRLSVYLLQETIKGIRNRQHIYITIYI